jgi:hypothetical protein
MADKHIWVNKRILLLIHGYYTVSLASLDFCILLYHVTPEFLSNIWFLSSHINFGLSQETSLSNRMRPLFCIWNFSFVCFCLWHTQLSQAQPSLYRRMEDCEAKLFCPHIHGSSHQCLDLSQPSQQIYMLFCTTQSRCTFTSLQNYR